MSENISERNTTITLGYLKRAGFLLPIVIPLGYLLAYIYELGYCNVYKIPKELITIDWTTVIIGVGAAFGGSLILLWFITMLLLPQQPKQQMGPIRRRIYFLLIVSVFLLFLALRYLLTSELIYIIVYFIVLSVLLFVFPVISKTSSQVKGYSNKLAAYDDQQRKTDDPLFNWLGSKGIILFILVVGLFTFSYLEGRAQAVNQDEFYVPSTHMNSVVLRIYGDTLICANVNVELREIKREYFILKADDQPPPVLISIRTGRLRLRE